MAKSEFSYPDENVSRDKKNSKEWGLNYAKAFWSSAARSESSYNFSSRTSDFIKLRKYADGSQSIDKYKKQLFDGDKTYTNIDYTVTSPGPKIVDILAEQLFNTPYKIDVDAIDETSKVKMDRKRLKMYADMIMKRANASMSRKLGREPFEINERDIPVTDEAYNVWMLMNQKAANAMAMEELINLGFSQNNFEYIKRKVARDLIIVGTGAMKCYVDDFGKIKIRYVDPVNLVTSWCEEDDYSDAKHIGEAITMPISKLKEEAPELSDEDIFEICKDVSGPRFNNPSWEFGSKSYYDMTQADLKKLDSWNVKVFDFETMQSDKRVFVKKVMPDGREFLDEKPIDYKPGKNSRHKKEVISGDTISYYSGKWVVNTDHIYSWGRSTNMARPIENGRPSKEPMSSFIILTPNMYDMRNTSHVQRAINHIDQICMYQMKMQQLVIEAAPPGYSIDIGAVTAALSKMGLGKDVKPLEIRRIRNQIGDIYWSSIREGGEPIYNTTPVTPLPNGLDESVERIAGLINNQIQRMNEDLGMNPAVDSTKPDERASPSNMERSAFAFKASMRLLLEDYHDMTVRCAKKVGTHYVSFIKNGWKVDEIEYALGKALVDTVKIQEIPDCEFAYRFKMLPEDREVEDFLISVKEAVKAGFLMPEDEMMLRNIADESLEKAHQYMIYRRAEIDKKRLQEEQAKIKYQAEANAQSAQASARAEMIKEQKKIQLEAQAKIAEINAKAAADKGLEFEKRLTVAVENEYKKDIVVLASKVKREEQKEVAEIQGSGGEPDSMKRMTDRALSNIKSREREGYDLQRDSMPKEAGDIEPDIGISQPV